RFNRTGYVYGWRFTTGGSGLEDRGLPRRIHGGTRVLEALVEPVVLVLPELHPQRHDAEATPMRRPREVRLVVIAGFEGVPLREQRLATLDRLGLVGRHGADAAASDR